VIHHPVRPSAGSVDLVDDDDRLQPLRQRLARDEAGLRHRTLDGVHQQQHAVDHRQHAFDFTAKVRMPRRVYDVDVSAFVVDRAVLREDRDATLALQVVRVHDAFGNLLVLAERAGLLQQFVDQRGLAVVDVGNDCDVAQLAFHDVSFSFDISRSGATTPHSLTFAVPSNSSFPRTPYTCTALLGVYRQPLALPEPPGQAVIQDHPRQRAEQSIDRPQRRSTCLDGHLLELIQRHRPLQHEGSDPRPPQRCQMRAATQRLADVLGQHADVRALAAFHIDHQRVAGSLHAPQAADGHLPWRSFDHQPGAGQFIQWTPSRFSAECIGGTCSIVPAKRDSTVPIASSETSTAAVPMTAPSASPVVVVTPSFSVAR